METLKDIEDFYRRLGKGNVSEEEIKKYGLNGNLPPEEVKKMRGERRKIFEERNNMTTFYIHYFTRKAEEREAFVKDYQKRQRIIFDNKHRKP